MKIGEKQTERLTRFATMNKGKAEKELIAVKVKSRSKPRRDCYEEEDKSVMGMCGHKPAHHIKLLLEDQALIWLIKPVPLQQSKILVL